MAGIRKDGVKDPYIDQNGVLLNKLSITDSGLLQRAETDLTSYRNQELLESPIKGDYDLKHMQAIHRHLFQDVYPWAGEIRTVDISKGGDLFAKHHFIESGAKKVFADLVADKPTLLDCNKLTFCERMAYHLGEVNALHPFREGNGRTQRIIFTQLAHEAGREIDWQSIDQKKMIEASIEAFYGSHDKMTDLLLDCVSMQKEKGREL